MDESKGKKIEDFFGEMYDAMFPPEDLILDPYLENTLEEFRNPEIEVWSETIKEWILIGRHV